MDKELIIAAIKDTLNALSIDVTRQILENIVEKFEAKNFTKNELFVIEGKISNEYFFLLSGYMRAFTHNLEGAEVTTYFYTPNGPVFEIASLFTRVRSPENIQALTDCKGYSIPFERLNALFHSVPEFRELGRAMLVKEFSQYKERTLSLYNRTSEERYLDLVNCKKDLFNYVPLKYIASYLGITDSTLSRLRKKI